MYKRDYIESIIKLLEKCEDPEILDLIYQLLCKCV